MTAFNPPAAPLTAADLRLERGGRTLIKALNLHVYPGEAVVLLGPNGSGKTTLLRALAGLVRPAAGSISIEPGAGAIAFLGHADALKPSETVETALQFWTALHGADDAEITTVMRRLALAHLARRSSSTLSAGQKRRAALARIALSNRPIWLLDEPAAPLDVRSRERLAGLVADHRAKGGLVIAATHLDLGWTGARKLELAS